MKFICDKCNAQYAIADEKVGEKGVKVKCKKCSNIITVQPENSASDKTQVVSTAPSQRSTDTELNAAFQSMLPNQVKAPADSSQTANTSFQGGDSQTKIWYVAINDAQVGPLSLSEVQKRFTVGELHQESMAWKTGMSDWLPVVDIPDLAKALGMTRADNTSTGSSAKQSQVNWQPTAASALSSLAQEELLTSIKEKEQAVAKPPTGLPNLGLPAKANKDLFGGNVGDLGVSAADPLGASPAWSVPQKGAGRGKTSMLPWVFGGAALLLVATGTIVYLLLQQHAAVAPVAAVPAAVAPPPPAAVAPTPAAAAAVPPSPSPESAAVAQNQAVAKEVADDSTSHPSEHHKGRLRHSKEHATAANLSARHEPSVAAPEAESTASTEPVKANLSKDDIWNVVKQNAAKAATCLKAARGKNEIAAGTYTFVLDWTIRPNGSVTDAHLKGPPATLAGSLPACFATVLSQWHFPASQEGTPIRNFPFGPVTVP